MTRAQWNTWSWLALAGLVAAPASADPVVIAGGALDPAYSDQADVYIGTPAPPRVPRGPACAAAKAYVDLHHAGRYAEVPSLFADDAVLMEPTRLNIRGKEQIMRFYADAIGKGTKPVVVAVYYVGDATDCLVELAVRQTIDGKPRYRLASMDHFTVDRRGKIVRMVAFQRAGRIGLAPPRMEK